jgi:hypothetical protein
MTANVVGTARTRWPGSGRVAVGVLLSILGVATIFSSVPGVASTGRSHGVAGLPGGAPPAERAAEPSQGDYLAVAALRGDRSTLVGVALARMRGDTQELVLGVCGLEPNRPYRLVIDGTLAGSLTPSEHGVLNASLSSVPGADAEALPEYARPVSKVERVELRDGGGASVASGTLRPVTARGSVCSPPAAGATARARRATATP